MWTFALDVVIAIVFFGLGAWLWPKIVGTEAALEAEIADLRSRLFGRDKK